MVKTPRSSILVDLLEPVSASLNKEAAQKLSRLRAKPRLQARIDRLARKCNQGTLSPEERSEYESLVLAGDIIAILQARARLLLARRERSV